MSSSKLRIGVVGCGRAARAHVGRLKAIEGVSIVGLTDSQRPVAEEMSRTIEGSVVYDDVPSMLGDAKPDVLAVFTPHRAHYRPAMDGLQAGCHVFIEKPLSTNLQEAVDITNLARARGLIVGVGQQYRLSPVLARARALLAAGEIGSLRLVTATMTQPWLNTLVGPGESWRLDPRVSGGGIVCDAGEHLLDALLWTTGRTAVEVASFQERLEGGPDVVTAAAIRLSENLPATLAISGVSQVATFELVYYGDNGRLRATDRELFLRVGVQEEGRVEVGGGVVASIDEDFVDAVRSGSAPCCSAEEAQGTVRLLESILRSAAMGQMGGPTGSSMSSRAGV